MADGIINVLKPPGMTSHDVIAYLRGVLKTKKIGHAGTLDPDAAGVLPVFIGKATRLLEYVAEDRKSYRAEVTFGIMTDTGDDSGNVIYTSQVFTPSKEQTAAALNNFLGQIMQTPPMYSAIRHQGQKLYQYARAGIEVERMPRTINIYALEVVTQGDSYLLLDVVCSKGTYIRTLCEDIARSLGMCGTISFLLRTAAGEFLLKDAATLEEIASDHRKHLLSPEQAVKHLPELFLTEKQALRLSQGVKTSIAGTNDGRYRLKAPKNIFIGIGCAEGERVQAEKIIDPFTTNYEVF